MDWFLYDNGLRHERVKHTVYNFSGYMLSAEEYKALSFHIDHHIPTLSRYNAIETKFG